MGVGGRGDSSEKWEPFIECSHKHNEQLPLSSIWLLLHQGQLSRHHNTAPHEPEPPPELSGPKTTPVKLRGSAAPQSTPRSREAHPALPRLLHLLRGERWWLLCQQGHALAQRLPAYCDKGTTAARALLESHFFSGNQILCGVCPMRPVLKRSGKVSDHISSLPICFSALNFRVYCNIPPSRDHISLIAIVLHVKIHT